jgi:tRNA 2-thiouridine synthesizing protein A
MLPGRLACGLHPIGPTVRPERADSAPVPGNDPVTCGDLACERAKLPVNQPIPDDELVPSGTRPERTAALMERVRPLTGAPCRICNKALCGHEAVMAILLGSRHAPRCASCAAREHGEAARELCERSRQWIVRRDCFLDAWLTASANEGFGEADRPACLFDEAHALPAKRALDVALDTALDAPPTADAIHDAGDLGCGDLVIDLKFRFAELAPGAVLEVRATDPAAPIDLPAWCGLVGHTLLHASPPRFWIRRKERQ